MKLSKLNGLLVMSVALALGTGCAGKKEAKNEAGAAAAQGGLVKMEDVDDSMNDLVKGERYQIIYDDEDMYKGAAEPLVTIVEFTDFQCPYCSKLTSSLKEVAEKYPEDVRVVLRHFPLTSIHKDAMLASQATLAANAQDPNVGWALHDKLFENQRKLKRADIEKFAEEVGVPDMDKFKKDLDDGTYEQAVKDDMAFGRKFAVRSTPSFFVNGKPMRGAKPADQISADVEAEMKEMQKLIDAGSSRAEIYARVMKASKAEREAPQRDAKQQQKRPGQPEPDKNYAVPLDDRPAWGEEDALVTIVEFSDFQCPYCSRVVPTLKKIKEEYPQDVRIVFRNQPLPMHPKAPSAARAALAAARQGDEKFWEMHDKLFDNQRELSDEKYVEFAEAIGLDVEQFKKDYEDQEIKTMVDEDQKIANQFGARGTPAFFVNGRFLSGAQPFESFDALIKEEKEKAEKFVADKGIDRKDAYAEMSKGWETEVKIPPPPPPADFKRRDVTTDGLPAKGNVKNPDITIVECSDFDCPYCKRATNTVKELMDNYEDKVAFYFAHNPLPMHKNAEPAHRAAIAAEKQGKFWEMHDKLFDDKTKRSDQDLLALAEEIGLDGAQWQADFEAAETAEKVKEDAKMCAKLEVRGVPGFIINGRLMSGAQPWPVFKSVIEEELNGGFEATQKNEKEDDAKKGDDKGDAKKGDAKKGDAKKGAKKDEKGE